MKKSTYVDYIVTDVLSHLEGLTSRAMFGGYGLYLNGKIFGIIAEEILYFKTDKSNRADYEARGSRPFSYEGAKGKKIVMSYWEVPSEVLEDADEVAEWAKWAARVTTKREK